MMSNLLIIELFLTNVGICIEDMITCVHMLLFLIFENEVKYMLRLFSSSLNIHHMFE